MNFLSRKMSGALVLLTVLMPCAFATAADSTPAPDSASSASLTARLNQHLVILDKNGAFKPFDAAALKNVKYIAFYHSASWCPPCKLFTPKLVKFYNAFKPQHPDFELIFVSHDDDPPSMLAYMKTDGMAWPAVRFDDVDGLKLKDMDSSEGLPDLILTDANGKVLSDTFPASGFVGPDKVLDDIKRIVH